MNPRRALPALAVIAAIAGLAAPALAFSPHARSGSAQPQNGGGRSGAVSASSAGLLWATINSCDVDSHRLGVRASMPGNGRRQRMYMRFRADYYDGAGDSWKPVDGAVSRWLYVGSARFRYREAGWTFGLEPAPAGSSYTLRGQVDFEWRAKRTVRRGRARRARWVVLKRRTRATRSGVAGAAGAGDEGISKALCLML